MSELRSEQLANAMRTVRSYLEQNGKQLTPEQKRAIEYESRKDYEHVLEAVDKVMLQRGNYLSEDRIEGDIRRLIRNMPKPEDKPQSKEKQ